MAYILIRHKVEDYEKWKKAFDDYIDRRRESGEKTWQVFRDEEDPNMVSVLNEWESAEKARAFTEDPDLKEKMGEAGVSGRPEIFYLGETDSGRI